MNQLKFHKITFHKQKESAYYSKENAQLTSHIQNNLKKTYLTSHIQKTQIAKQHNSSKNKQPDLHNRRIAVQTNNNNKYLHKFILKKK